MDFPPIKAVLFDLDDTLWPIAPVIARAESVLHDWLAMHVPRVAQQFSIEQLRARRLELLALHPHYQINLTELRRAALTEAFAALDENPAHIEDALDVFLEARHQVTLFEDVRPALANLQECVLLGSVTNGVTDLELIGLAGYFHSSIAAHSFGGAKPDPAIFHAACDALGVAPEEAVYIGDDPVADIEGAQKAGLRALWLNRFDQTLPAYIAPHASFRDLHEAHHWIAARCNNDK